MRFYIILLVLIVSSCNQNQEQEELHVYCGRKKDLVEPLFKEFEKETNIKIIPHYQKSFEGAQTIIEEQKKVADVFYSQDAGALGLLRQKQLLEVLDDDIINKVDKRYSAKDKTWVGISGRARVFVYNTDLVKQEDLPKSILDLADSKWKGKIAWAPTNASLISHISAMIKSLGKEKTEQWINALVDNEILKRPKNTPIVKDTADGKIHGGLVNHYYLYKVKEERKDKDFKAANHFFVDGDVGMLVNVAGVGIIKGSKNKANAVKFVNFLLKKQSQEYFSKNTSEYPLIKGVEARDGLKPLKDLNPVNIDLSDLDNAKESTELLQKYIK